MSENMLICDICEMKMQPVRLEGDFLSEKTEYHVNILVHCCCCCGFCKLISWEVRMNEDSTPPFIEPAPGIPDNKISEALDTKPHKLKMLDPKEGNFAISDKWIDGMLENHTWFSGLYNYFVPLRHKQHRYLEKHTPHFRAIINDVLYDTQTAKMFLMEEREITGSELCRMYNYVTTSGKYFRLISRYGMDDELTTLALKDVKKLLSHRPEIYREVIPDEVED